MLLHVTYEFQSESTLYSLPECQGTPCSKQVPYLKFKWQQRDSNPQPSGCGFESRCCHSICLVVSSLEMQRRLIQTNVHYKFFTLFQKKNDSQTFKSSSFKKPSLQFYLTDKTCFDECFLFHLITESHCFL